jgi:hypothetical protein
MRHVGEDLNLKSKLHSGELFAVIRLPGYDVGIEKGKKTEETTMWQNLRRQAEKQGKKKSK